MGDLQGRRALVTGASSGLGADFARILAERGASLVLVARREDRLRALAQEIEDRHRTGVEVMPLDLYDENAPRRLYADLQSRGLAIDVLVNNAGHGLYGEFLEIPWERERQMLQVDIVALTHLTKLFLPDMVARNFGHVLQVASIGAYQPCPTYASYAAAKAYVLHFGEALAHELRHTKVRVTVLSPGYTETEFLQVSGQRKTLYQKMLAMGSREVAEIGIRAMLKGKPSLVAGWMNGLAAWSIRLTPRRMATAVAAWTMRQDQAATGAAPPVAVPGRKEPPTDPASGAKP